MVDRKTTHAIVGFLTAIMTLLVNSISITYFLGTSRWCQEVVETYQFDHELTRKSVLLKRKNFPWALGGMLIMLTIATLGAAADPFAFMSEQSVHFDLPHYYFAMLGMVLIIYGFYRQADHIQTNHQIITEIVDLVFQREAEVKAKKEQAASSKADAAVDAEMGTSSLADD